MSGSRTTASRRPAPPTASQFAGRLRRRRLRGVLYGLATGLGVAVAFGAVWVVGWSDVTALETVRVEGAEGPLADQVSLAAEAPLGVPLIRLDTDAMTVRVSELPELASVSVHRSWPRSLVVSVTPRVAEATIKGDGSWWLVDGSGVLFGGTAEQPDDLPVLDAPTADEAEATRAAAVAVLTGLPVEVRDLVETVSAHSEADVRMELTSGATVRWGGAEDGADKAAVLLALLGEDATTYDVSSPDHPALVP